VKRELACAASVHAAIKCSPARLETECVFIGVQHDDGYEDLALFNCRVCQSTLAVRVERRAA
jgi:hypothetical protein